MKSKVVFSHLSDIWATPRDLFNALDSCFHFTLDPCANLMNFCCPKYYTEKENGLVQDWTGEIVFCNPPYSQIRSWVQKAVDSEAFTVMLLPARTDVRWFHDLIYRKYPIEFIKGRLKFGCSKNSAPFPSMLVFIDNLKYVDASIH